MKLLNEMFSVVGTEDDSIRLRLNAGHPIYQAHFPGNPITPGVCIVQLVTELAGERLGRQLTLSRIVNLKFISTITPTADPEVSVRLTTTAGEDGLCKAKGTIESGGQVKTKFSLELS